MPTGRLEQTEARRHELCVSFHVAGRGLASWTVIYYLPRYINTQMDHGWSCQELTNILDDGVTGCGLALSRIFFSPFVIEFLAATCRVRLWMCSLWNNFHLCFNNLLFSITFVRVFSLVVLLNANFEYCFLPIYFPF